MKKELLQILKAKKQMWKDIANIPDEIIFGKKLTMVKKLRHHWKIIPGTHIYHPEYKCEVCGCVKSWDFNYDAVMYRYGTKTAYVAPSCMLPNTINYDGKKI